MPGGGDEICRTGEGLLPLPGPPGSVHGSVTDRVKQVVDKVVQIVSDPEPAHAQVGEWMIYDV